MYILKFLLPLLQNMNFNQEMVYYTTHNTFWHCINNHDHTSVEQPLSKQLYNANLCFNGHSVECWLIFVTFTNILENKNCISV